MQKRFTLTTAVAVAAVLTYACGSPPSEENARDATSTVESQTQGRVGNRMTAEPAVAAGTELTFVIDETISTDDAQPGQSFDAHVAEAVTGTGGTILIPAGAAARGTVVEARNSEGADDTAALVVRLETVEFGGTMVPVDGTVIRADTDASADDSGAETAGKIAIGAAAGAIVGQIIGKSTESTMAGAGAGAVAGTIVALTTRNGSATLERGATVVVRLDRPLRSD